MGDKVRRIGGNGGAQGPNSIAILCPFHAAAMDHPPWAPSCQRVNEKLLDSPRVIDLGMLVTALSTTLAKQMEWFEQLKAAAQEEMTDGVDEG